MQRQEEWLKELDAITDNMKEHFTKDNAKLEEWILQVEQRVDQRPHVSVEESKTKPGDEALEEQRLSRMQNLADQVRKRRRPFINLCESSKRCKRKLLVHVRRSRPWRNGCKPR